MFFTVDQTYEHMIYKGSSDNEEPFFLLISELIRTVRIKGDFQAKDKEISHCMILKPLLILSVKEF